MAVDQPGLFDAEGLVADVELTLGDSPIARPARVGFLGGLIAVLGFRQLADDCAEGPRARVRTRDARPRRQGARMIPDSTAEFDAIADADILIESREEAMAWLLYSMTVLQPRASDLQRAAGRLMFNPLLFLRWRKAQRRWEANTHRMNAILKANQEVD